MQLWILDKVGYDARGGNASVWSTVERAKASAPHIKWRIETNGSNWMEDIPEDSLADFWYIYPAELDQESDT